MRADRLISILICLKRRKKVTARELASLLEVCERTIYRDIVAMSTAGIPIYTEKGPGGGIAMVDTFQADLVNMTEEEIQALGMLSIPQEFERLGLAEHLRSALQKLNVMQGTVSKASRKAIYFDPSGWKNTGAGQSILQNMLDAVQQGRKCWVRYRYIREMVNESVVNILGLVTKEYNWYVVWQMAGKISVRDFSSIIDVRVLEEPAERVENFDLQDFWQAWCQKSLQERGQYEVRLKVAKHALLLFNQIFSEQSLLHSEDFYNESLPDWLETELHFSSMDEARYRLLGLGAAVEVLAPKVLQRTIVDYAEQVCHIYSTQDALKCNF
ncbi:MAG: WYL domain-containing protein [Anaerolineaceae bacterium]|nr:WYL domain-containing protein [Anaerolineaceae bacterium]